VAIQTPWNAAFALWIAASAFGLLAMTGDYPQVDEPFNRTSY